VKEYHETRFWQDVRRVQVRVVPADHPIEDYRGIGFFESLDAVAVDERWRARFAVCFYFESLIDQGLHHFFHAEHSRFQTARPLPKFGRFGLGPHVEHPSMFLAAARAGWAMSRETLVRLLVEGAIHFPAWADAFFRREGISVAGVDLFRTIRDRDDGDLGIVVWRELRHIA
jgi:hypothetical protein